MPHILIIDFFVYANKTRSGFGKKSFLKRKKETIKNLIKKINMNCQETKFFGGSLQFAPPPTQKFVFEITSIKNQTLRLLKKIEVKNFPVYFLEVGITLPHYFYVNQDTLKPFCRRCKPRSIPCENNSIPFIADFFPSSW